MDKFVVKNTLFYSIKPKANPRCAKHLDFTGDHFGAFIEQQVSRGRYGSARNVVRAGLLKSL